MTALVNEPLLTFRDPLLFFPICFFVLWFSVWTGAFGFKRFRSQVSEVRQDLNVIQGATLTLLGLIIGFTFSMLWADTTSARTMRNRRPTRSAPNTSAPTYYLPPMRRECGCCF